MAETTITIQDGMPTPNSVAASGGAKVTFENSDGEGYTIDFGGADISNEPMPLHLPQNGSASMTIRSGSCGQTFQYVIKDDTGEQVWPAVSDGPGDQPPQVIVR